LKQNKEAAERLLRGFKKIFTTKNAAVENFTAAFFC